MKERSSFTFDKETIEILDQLSQTGEYRNKSHIVEQAIKLLGSEKVILGGKNLKNFKSRENEEARQLKNFLMK